MLDEMQSYHDDRTEKWRESDKGGEFQERMDAYGNVLSELEGLE